MGLFYSILIVVTTLALHHYLSTRKNWLYGAIIPVVYTVAIVWIKMNKIPDLSIWRMVFFGLTLLIIWADGRDKYKKKINKEMDKMKTIDLK